MYGVDNMTFTVVLVVPHINHDGILMVEQAGGFSGTDLFDPTETLLYLGYNQHHDNSQQGQYQQKMVTGKFYQLLSIHQA